MPWARYDDSFSMHRKVLRLKAHPKGLAALGLHLLGNTWSRHQGTRGFLPEYIVTELGGRGGLALGTLLEDVGMFDRDVDGEPGWWIHDFDVYSSPDDDGRSADERRRDLSAKRAEAGRRGGKAKAQGQQRPSKAVALLQQTSTPVPVPDPVVATDVATAAADPPTTVAHRLVAELVPGPLPRQQRARLYEVIDQLVADAVPEPRIRVALTDWTSRADVSPGLLPHLVPRDLLEDATPW